MISFYPGPSKVDPGVPLWTRKAYQRGVLSINHRSPEFQELYQETVRNIKKRLNIPPDYWVFFTSSATECWEIIAQSLLLKESYHFFNGAFGRKWFDYTQKICPGARSLEFGLEMEPDFGLLHGNPEVICLTQNETSNGTQIPYPTLLELRSSFPNSLIAVDATSSMAGIRLPIEAGDVWYASVQKCFGLPAGMAVMICSPRSIERIQDQDENRHYNSLKFILLNAKKNQTTYTPNVLGIYLLHELMKSRRKISAVARMIEQRMSSWVKLIQKHKTFDPLVKNSGVRSHTVLAVKATKEDVSAAHRKANEAGFLLGQGYGSLQSTTFRIANFPALKDLEIAKLQDFLISEFE